MNPLAKSLLTQVGIALGALFLALSFTFFLPRLGDANPLDTIMSNIDTAQMTVGEMESIRREYSKALHLDTPVFFQLLHYLGSTFSLDFGISAINYPRTNWSIIQPALQASLLFAIPIVIFVWFLGGVVGVTLATVTLPFRISLFALLSATLACPIFLPGQSLFRSSLAAFALLFFIRTLRAGSHARKIQDSVSSFFAASLGVAPYRSTLALIREVVRVPRQVSPGVIALALSGWIAIEIVFSVGGFGSLLQQAILANDFTLIQAITTVATLLAFVATLAIHLAGLVHGHQAGTSPLEPNYHFPSIRSPKFLFGTVLFLLVLVGSRFACYSPQPEALLAAGSSLGLAFMATALATGFAGILATIWKLSASKFLGSALIVPPLLIGVLVCNSFLLRDTWHLVLVLAVSGFALSIPCLDHLSLKTPRTILPSLLATSLLQFTFAILCETTLSVLGLGAQSSGAPTLGQVFQNDNLPVILLIVALVASPLWIRASLTSIPKGTST
jgi:peptide/nickel transport system permease protein